MKRLLLCVAILFPISFSQAQTKAPQDEYSLAWNQGKVIFYTGDTVECMLRYNQTLSVGALQIMKDDNIITLPSKDVLSFSFYDERKGQTRYFSSMAVTEEEYVNQKVFLESLYNDTQFVILNHRTMDVPYDYMNYTRLISKPVRVSKKYILNAKTGELLPLSKENTLKLLESRKNEITAFIQEHHLRFKKVADFIDVLEYHSSL